MDIERQREEYKDQKIMVSVICPTYNHAPYIKKALDSILSQNVDFPYEILVGNDCSPDNSREILSDYEKKYPSLIKVYNRERNLGPTKNGYDLYSRARGKYLITLELDDYWIDNDKLKKEFERCDLTYNIGLKSILKNSNKKQKQKNFPVNGNQRKVLSRFIGAVHKLNVVLIVENEGKSDP